MGEAQNVLGDADTNEELRHLVAEVVAVVLEEAVGLHGVAGPDLVEVLLEELLGDVGDAQLYHSHWGAVWGGPHGSLLYASSEVVLVAVHHHARVPGE